MLEPPPASFIEPELSRTSATSSVFFSLISELADLYYHSLVLLAARGLTLEAVEAELDSRHAIQPRATGA